VKGLVIKSTGSWYAVRIENDEVIECRLKGKIRLEDRKTTNPVSVGDSVEVERDLDGSNQISHIYPRKNYIIRKSINLSKQAHIIASNLDQALLIATIVAPRTSLGFIDRFLVTSEAYGIETKIIFNKKDALDEEMIDLQNDMMKLYTDIGYDCIAVSAFDETDINYLRTLLKDKITLLSGHSGVGKSTLVNAIEPNLHLKTGDISFTHLKGMHTTTFAELFPLSFGGDIIDSPGIKELGLVEMKKEEVGNYFPEIFKHSVDCKFNNCLHVNEPHCAIIRAVETGAISAERYQSYLGILNGEEMDWKEWEIR
jgi:ribosome biogenesis GTPase / thiamine phosphate phosphatase